MRCQPLGTLLPVVEGQQRGVGHGLGPAALAGASAFSWPAGVRGDEPVGDRQGDRAELARRSASTCRQSVGCAAAADRERPAAGKGGRRVRAADRRDAAGGDPDEGHGDPRAAGRRSTGSPGTTSGSSSTCRRPGPRIAEELGIAPGGTGGAAPPVRGGPGAQAQVDWGDEGKILAHMGIAKVYSFHMVLSYSRDPFCCFTTSQDLADVLRLPPPGVRALRRGAR